MYLASLLRRLKYAGAEELPEYDIQRGICVGVNVMCISVVFLNLISGPMFYFISGNMAVLIGALLEALLVFGVIRLNKLKRYEYANAYFYTLIVAATFYFSAILGKGSETQLMIVFILGLVFFIFRTIRTRIFCIVITLLLLALLEANYIYHFISPANLSERVMLLVRWLVYAVVISLVLLIFYLYNKNTGLIIQLHTYSKRIKASLSSEERMNELKNHFFQSISHDIRGAYFGVSSICAAIQDKVEMEEPVTAQLADNLMDASENYKFILSNFLEMSKFRNASIDNIQLESFNVKKEIEKIVNLNRYVADQKGVKIHVFFKLGFPEYIIGDKLKIMRIVYNILSNALKFTRPHSVIEVTAEFGRDTWKLVIRDEGKGISPEQTRKIFQPYYTEKSEQNPEGVGLGLYITKYLTDMLDARINVSSHVNVGTSFEISFVLEKQFVS
jgi:signal transduction histidine kinase